MSLSIFDMKDDLQAVTLLTLPHDARDSIAAFLDIQSLTRLTLTCSTWSAASDDVAAMAANAIGLGNHVARHASWPLAGVCACFSIADAHIDLNQLHKSFQDLGGVILPCEDITHCTHLIFDRSHSLNRILSECAQELVQIVSPAWIKMCHDSWKRLRPLRGVTEPLSSLPDPMRDAAAELSTAPMGSWAAVGATRKHWRPTQLFGAGEPWCPALCLERCAVAFAISDAFRSHPRICFADAKCDLARDETRKIEQTAALLMRHRSLVCHVEGHAGARAPHAAAGGFSCQRALKVGALLVVSGADPHQLRLRGWGRAVAAIAQWQQGTRASRRCDLFFSLRPRTTGGHGVDERIQCEEAEAHLGPVETVTLPSRPEYYAAARRQGGSTSQPQAVPLDSFFADRVAQELVTAYPDRWRGVELPVRGDLHPERSPRAFDDTRGVGDARVDLDALCSMIKRVHVAG